MHFSLPEIVYTKNAKCSIWGSTKTLYPNIKIAWKRMFGKKNYLHNVFF